MQKSVDNAFLMWYIYLATLMETPLNVAKLPLFLEGKRTLKTKQCNKKSCTHDFKPDVGFCVRCADAGYEIKQDLCEQNLKFHYMDNL